jgi:hypothetical protein
MRGKVLFTLTGVISLAAVGSTALDRSSANADAFPYRLVVPGLAAESTSAPLSSVSAGHLSARNDGGFVVTGDVTNHSLGTITNVTVEVTATVGGVQTIRETTALVDAIAPGSTAPFRMVFALPGDESRPVIATVTGFDTTGPGPSATFAFSGPYPFQVGPPDPKAGVIPYSTVLEQLHAQFTNTSGRALTDIATVVAIYDGDGNVVWVGTGADLHVPFEQANVPQRLEAGQSGTFVVGIPIGFLNTIPGQITFAGFVNATQN